MLDYHSLSAYIRSLQRILYPFCGILLYSSSKWNLECMTSLWAGPLIFWCDVTSFILFNQLCSMAFSRRGVGSCRAVCTDQSDYSAFHLAHSQSTSYQTSHYTWTEVSNLKSQHEISYFFFGVAHRWNMVTTQKKFNNLWVTISPNYNVCWESSLISHRLPSSQHLCHFAHHVSTTTTTTRWFLRFLLRLLTTATRQWELGNYTGLVSKEIIPVQGFVLTAERTLKKSLQSPNFSRTWRKVYIYSVTPNTPIYSKLHCCAIILQPLIAAMWVIINSSLSKKKKSMKTDLARRGEYVYMHISWLQTPRHVKGVQTSLQQCT